MAHSKQTQNTARLLYIDEGLTLEKIADKLKVHISTLSTWKSKAKANGDNWEKMRAVNANGRTESLARNILIGLLGAFEKALIAIEAAEDIEPMTRVTALANLSEGFARSVNANKKLMPEISKLEVAFNVVDELTQFVSDKNPNLLREFSELLEPFAECLEKKLKD